MVYSSEKKHIGPVEKVSFPDLGEDIITARIDTGAQTSAIWASEIGFEKDQLRVVFFGEGHPAYTGKSLYFDQFSRTKVISSNGQSELRYKIPLRIVIGGKIIRSRFTLADRSAQRYPVLVGRNTLRGKFIVDVSKDSPLLNRGE